MALRLSTGLRNALLSNGVVADRTKTLAGTTFSLVDSGTEITLDDSGNGLGVYAAGDIIQVTTSTQTAIAVVATAAAAQITFTVVDAFAAEAGGERWIISDVTSGSFAEIFKGSQMRIYSGGQPADASATESGTLLCTITDASGAVTSGNGTNGLFFGVAASGTVAKKTGQVWSGVNAATNTAGWFRVYPVDVDDNDGAETTPALIRFDGSVSTSGAELNMSSTALTSGATTTIDTFTVTLPAS